MEQMNGRPGRLTVNPLLNQCRGLRIRRTTRNFDLPRDKSVPGDAQESVNQKDRDREHYNHAHNGREGLGKFELANRPGDDPVDERSNHNRDQKLDEGLT